MKKLVLLLIVGLFGSLLLAHAQDVGETDLNFDSLLYVEHSGKVWDAKVAHYTQQDSMNYVIPNADHQQRVWDAKVDFWQGQNDLTFEEYLDHQGNIWTAKAEMWQSMR